MTTEIRSSWRKSPGSILLFIDRDMDWSPEEWAIRNGGWTLPNGATLFGNYVDWVSILQNDEMLRDCAATRCEKILGLIFNPAAYILTWNCWSGAVAKLLAAVPKKSQAVIETEYGFVDSLESLRDLDIGLAARLAFTDRTRRA
jgi:hypothetical protein